MSNKYTHFAQGDLMPIFSVSYDLNLPDEYAAFYDILESYPHLHVMDSCWLVEVTGSSSELRDQLAPLLTNQDALFVTRINSDWAGAGTHCGEWLDNKDQRLSG